MSINEIQNQIVEEFSPLKDSLDKYKYLINLAKNLEPLNDEYKKSENSIQGCQSNAWVVTSIMNNKMLLKGDVDVMITKGILSLLLRVYNNQNVSEIADSDLYFLEKIGLKNSLSPQRANGVRAIVEHIKTIAKRNIE